MSNPMFSASVDASSVLSMLDRVAESAQFVTREVALDTAKRIVAEAQRRVKRATGQTGEGIHWEMTRDETGYVVLAYEAGAQPDPVDIYLEYGTNYSYARPFFFASAMVEEGAHMRRLEARLAEWLLAVGR